MENDKKLNKFLEKAYNKYGNTYDYSSVKYINNKTTIKIICKTHGEFAISPDNFLNKSKCGCPRCGEALRGINKRLNTEEFKNIIYNKLCIKLKNFKTPLQDYLEIFLEILLKKIWMIIYRNLQKVLFQENLINRPKHLEKV